MSTREPFMRQGYFSRKMIPAWLMLGIGLATSIFVASQVRQGIHDDAMRQFTFSADRIANQISDRLRSYELLLHAGAAVFAASESVGRDEWRSFVETSGAEKIVPGFEGIGFAKVILPGQLAAHVAEVRAEGFPGYEVHPPGEREIYTSIVYLEPFRDRNLRAFGYDMFSEPVRQQAMAQARETGRPALSGKVILVQETDADVQAGTLMYVPVYRNNAPLSTVEERHAAHVGWVYSPYRMSDLMSGILREWDTTEGRYVSLKIYDGTQASPEASLFDSEPDATPRSQAIIQQQHIIDFYGTRWLLAFERSPTAPAISEAPAGAALLAGAALSGLLFALLASLLNMRENAARIAANLTSTLRESREDLQEAQRIAQVGSWKLDIASGKVEWSDEIYRTFGVDPGGPAPSFTQLQAFFTPNGWERLSAAVARTLETGEPYDLELEVIKASGETGWISTRGELLSHENGHGAGLQGISIEITARKRAQIRIESLTRLYAALSECNRAIVQCATQDELLARICEVVVRQGGMKMAWIGLVDPESKRIVPVQHAGGDADFLDDIEVSVDAGDVHGRGATGTATRENRSVWIDDFATSALSSPWRARGERYGWAASAAIPICRENKPIGALTLYSGQKGWFDPETRRLLEEIGSSLSSAIDRFDARARADEYHVTLLESEQRFRSLVEQSIAGAFIIQDGKIVYANPRTAEILGYADGNMLIGQLATELIAPADKADVARTLQRLASGEIETAELLFKSVRRDGSTVEVGANIAVARYQSLPATIGLMQDISDRKVAENQIRRYTSQLEHTFMQTVGLANTLSEMRDPYTVGHERRVAEIAIAIGSRMGLSEHQLEGLRVGGYLHDVGKMAIPAEILSKPTKLTALEYSLIKEHAERGYEILKEVDFPWPVAQIARQHHERVDGSGYPQGLKGDEILLEARIVAVADVIESMSSHRPYRPGLGLDKALAEIERGLGSAYDAEIASICLKMFREEGFVLPEA